MHTLLTRIQNRKIWLVLFWVKGYRISMDVEFDRDYHQAVSKILLNQHLKKSSQHESFCCSKLIALIISCN